jgi:tetratricopeptide (TPR) repeat protein
MFSARFVSLLKTFLMKNLLSLVFLLFSSILLFAQNGVKSEKELAQNFIQILQTQNLKNLEAISAPAELYPLFVETFKEKSKEEIQRILANDKNSLSKKFQNIFQYFSVLEIENEKITIQKIGKSEELYLIAPNYYQIPLQISLQSTTDTIFLEAYKHKKRWYLTDFTSPKIIPLQNILKKHSKYSIEQYKEMAKSYWEKKEYNKILEVAEKFKLIDVEDAEMLYYEGLAHKALGDTLKAHNTFSKAYAVRYNQEINPQLVFELFEFYANNSNYYEALNFGEMCIIVEYELAKVIPKILDIMQQEKKAYVAEGTKLRESPYIYEKYIKILDLASSKEALLADKDKVKVFTWKAELEMEDEKWLEAKEYFAKALALEPENFELLYELAWLENETQNYSKALEYAQRGYKIKKDAEILAEMAYSKKNLNDCKGAIADYNTLFAMGEEFMTARKLKNRGDCYKMLKNNKLACADYKKALQMGENDEEMQNWLKKNCK